jgi:hypothetical protein
LSDFGEVTKEKWHPPISSRWTFVRHLGDFVVHDMFVPPGEKDRERGEHQEHGQSNVIVLLVAAQHLQPNECLDREETKIARSKSTREWKREEAQG